MGTLVMLHGLTGTSDLMRPLAEELCPEGWNLLVPEAPFPHPDRGYGWWLRSAPPTDPLDAAALAQVDISLAKLCEEISAAAPSGPLIVGGFSQGSALAQELLQTDLATRIIGVLVLGGKSARPLELRIRLAELAPRKMLSMHGERDHMVPLWQGEETALIFEEAGWDTLRLRHEKGHMVNLRQKRSIVSWIQFVAGQYPDA